MATYRELLEQVKAEIAEVDAREAQAASGAAWIDVREDDEWQEGHIPGAIHVPRGHLESRIEAAVPDKSTPLIVYCAVGNRSAFASFCNSEATTTAASTGPTPVIKGVIRDLRCGPYSLATAIT